MNSFSIKLGKVINALKNEGMLSTIQRGIAGLKMARKNLAEGDVLYVTGGGGVGASALYRCVHQAEELNLHRIRAEVIVQDSHSLLKSVPRYSVFILHRPVWDKRLRLFIEQLKIQHKTLVFETDDLLFDPDYLKQVEYLKNINTLERTLYQQGLGSTLLKDDFVRACITSTSFLAEKLKAKGKQIFVSPNKLSQQDVAIAAQIVQHRKLHPSNQVVIGYFSGTPGHDRDFETIAGVLTAVLRQHSLAQLQVFGPVAIPEILDEVHTQVVRQRFTASRKKHFQNISSVDINIVPLEENDFCQAKSELKFFEAGIVGVPTIASATQTFREAITDGQDGFLAKDTPEWTEKLIQLIGDPTLRENLGEQAKQTAIERFSTQHSNNEPLYQYLRGHLHV